jgi:hypothetical protein
MLYAMVGKFRHTYPLEQSQRLISDLVQSVQAFSLCSSESANMSERSVTYLSDRTSASPVEQ